MPLRLTAAAAVWLAFSAPAAAESRSPDGFDPNQKVCEKVTVTGSRLAVKRICATRAEWAEKRRQDRDVVDQAQRSPCVLQRNGATGRPSC